MTALNPNELPVSERGGGCTAERLDLRDVLRSGVERVQDFGTGDATGTRMVREVASPAPDQQDYAEAGAAPAPMVGVQDDTPSASNLSNPSPSKVTA